MTTITKHIGEGFGRGELYAALNYDSTDQFGGIKINSIGFTNTLSRGIIGTAEDVNMLSANIVPLQVNLNASAGNGSYTLAAAYFKTGISTLDLSNVQACGVLARVSLKYDCESAYGVQSHVGIDADMATGVSHANIAAISGKIDLDNSVTQGNVQAGLFIIEATSGKTVTQNSHGVQIAIEANSVATNGLYFGGSGEVTNAIDIATSTNAYSINFNTPSTAIFKFLDDGSIVDLNGMSTSSTLDDFNKFSGYITIKIGSTTTHLLTLDTIPS